MSKKQAHQLSGPAGVDASENWHSYSVMVSRLCFLNLGLRSCSEHRAEAGMRVAQCTLCTSRQSAPSLLVVSGISSLDYTYVSNALSGCGILHAKGPFLATREASVTCWFCHALFPPPAAVFFYVEREMVHGEVLPDCTPSATPNFLRAKPPQ